MFKIYLEYGHLPKNNGLSNFLQKHKKKSPPLFLPEVNLDKNK